MSYCTYSDGKAFPSYCRRMHYRWLECAQHAPIRNLVFADLNLKSPGLSLPVHPILRHASLTCSE